MPYSISETLLWLFAINLGIAAGAGFYETRIVVPQWLTGSQETGYHWNRAAAVDANVGLRFWSFVTTLPLTLLTLASLIAATLAPLPLKGWWLLAATAALFDRLMTFGYFIPTMLGLMQADRYSNTEAALKALQWVQLGYLRHAALLIAFLATLKAFAEFYLSR
ncbi:MAG: DUF1772 domain-containing protein [Candidatus Sericytochromatia bacterium]|nr:DUF1772 domain-containing protein [Candidatus Sericytochromatia bacterium]